MKRAIIILIICGLQFHSIATQAQEKDKMLAVWGLQSMTDLYKKYSPLDYLEMLKVDFKNKGNFNVVSVMPSPDNWVKEEHIEKLIKLIYITDSTKSIMSVLSSYLPNDKFSSVGREAQNLIECFRAKKSYPAILNSFGPPDKEKGKELEGWWTKYKSRKP